jgi:hypothetical protein
MPLFSGIAARYTRKWTGQILHAETKFYKELMRYLINFEALHMNKQIRDRCKDRYCSMSCKKFQTIPEQARQ